MRTFRKAQQVIVQEVRDVEVRPLLGRLLAATLPLPAGGRMRALALRVAGASIGRGVLVASMPRVFGGRGCWRRISIGSHCYLNVGVTLEAGAPIVLEPWVTIGPDTMVLTTTHRIGDQTHRCSEVRTGPVRVRSGAWLGARVVVLPGVTIGSGAVVGAGALVTADVPPNALVAGVPARLVRVLHEGFDDEERRRR